MKTPSNTTTKRKTQTISALVTTQALLVADQSYALSVSLYDEIARTKKLHADDPKQARKHDELLQKAQQLRSLSEKWLTRISVEFRGGGNHRLFTAELTEAAEIRTNKTRERALSGIRKVLRGYGAKEPQAHALSIIIHTLVKSALMAIEHAAPMVSKGNRSMAAELMTFRPIELLRKADKIKCLLLSEIDGELTKEEDEEIFGRLSDYYHRLCTVDSINKCSEKTTVGKEMKNK